MPVGRTVLVDNLHLGPTGSVLSFSESSLPVGDQGKLGQIFEKDAKFYRLVQHHQGTGTVATVDGGVAYWRDKANWVVTADASDGEGLADGVAGGYNKAAITHLNYCFIQMGGYQAAVIVAASTVNGDHLTGHASTDNVLTRTAAGTAAVDKQVATALSTRGSTTSDSGNSVSNSSKVSWNFGSLI